MCDLNLVPKNKEFLEESGKNRGFGIKIYA